MEIIPHGETLDRVVDRVVDAGLWVGRLITQRHIHESPSEHHAVIYPVAEPLDLFERTNRWDADGRYTDKDGNEAA